MLLKRLDQSKHFRWDSGLSEYFGRILAPGRRGLDKSRYNDRSSPWRKRTGAGPSLVRRWASVPMRLVFVTTAAAFALVTQFVIHNSGSLPEINLQNLIKPRPVAIAGVASVIDATRSRASSGNSSNIIVDAVELLT
ncbi:hypothetical protein [Mesorhizobium silamurunense]|uniref:hypothetical protein n=1 Tax=Mesorhizobium silamurunense TaxID=499528 RepID=UPI001FED3FDF|nr:hypothetical protein [Mesorhizobium silamurunense]